MRVRPEATAFLQAFVAELVNVVGQAGCPHCVDQTRHIEQVGLLASGCLEGRARDQLHLVGDVSPDQYSDIIIELKNRIGGGFSRESSPPGMIRVVNDRCPFGDQVKEAPDLCRMTSSVFGGIAARNFGYAKVELRKRIAVGDGCCEVCVYLDKGLAEREQGTEYSTQSGALISRDATVSVTARPQRRIPSKWCPTEPEAGARTPPTIIGESPAMRSALRAVEVVAPTAATVLLTGETGSGKELMARAVHALSDRWRQPLVTVNCGAIPENLIETALFGHEKGAFTGACDVHHGYFARAQKGTLFLDEIDSIPLLAQAKLLRVLQEGEFERVGGKRTLQADVRIIAASNRDIQALVDTGRFRSDLFYRLNVVPIGIPPLRERVQDLLPLIDHILGRLCERYRAPAKQLGSLARSKALAYHWPGNIRELENVFERAFIFSSGPVIEDIDVPRTPAESVVDAGDSWRTHKRRAAKEAEASALVSALQRSQGNVDEVAEVMGITARAVRMKLKSHGLSARDFR
jgi:DNA-binding NtrC family response regulator